MNDKKIRKMVMAAMMAALVFVSTKIIQVPSIGGYKHLGDGFVLLSGWLLGPAWGGAAAAIGSALTDLISGYAHYVPGTLIIKGVEAMVASLIFTKLKRNIPAMIVSGIVGGVIMIAGYFVYKWVLLGRGLPAAIESMPGNVIQAVIGIVISTLIMKVLQKVKFDKQF